MLTHSVCMVRASLSVVCQPSTALLIDCLDYSPSPPPLLLCMIQGKWYFRAEVVLTEPETAQNTRPTFHLSPLSNPPRTWKHRKKARSPRWECLSTRRGNWKRLQRMGEARSEEGEIGKGRSECWRWCRDVEKDDNFPPMKHVEWISLVNMPANNLNSSSGDSDKPLYFCQRLNRRTFITGTASWFHSHWSCYYTDEGKNEAGKVRSGFHILATALPFWLISKSETVMGKATLWFFGWFCPSVTLLLLSVTLFLQTFLQTFLFSYKMFVSYQFRCRPVCIWSKWHVMYSITINCYFRCFQTFDSITCSVCIWCLKQHPVLSHLVCCSVLPHADRQVFRNISKSSKVSWGWIMRLVLSLCIFILGFENLV